MVISIVFCIFVVFNKLYMKKLFKIGLLPQVLVAIVLGILLGGILPSWGIRIFVTFNEIFSQLLSFLVPLIILGMVAPAIADMGV